jgi:hypothetical protein
LGNYIMKGDFSVEWKSFCKNNFGKMVENGIMLFKYSQIEVMNFLSRNWWFYLTCKIFIILILFTKSIVLLYFILVFFNIVYYIINFSQ